MPPGCLDTALSAYNRKRLPDVQAIMTLNEVVASSEIGLRVQVSPASSRPFHSPFQFCIPFLPAPLTFPACPSCLPFHELPAIPVICCKLFLLGLPCACLLPWQSLLTLSSNMHNGVTDTLTWCCSLLALLPSALSSKALTQIAPEPFVAQRLGHWQSASVLVLQSVSTLKQQMQLGGMEHIRCASVAHRDM